MYKILYKIIVKNMLSPVTRVSLEMIVDIRNRDTRNRGKVITTIARDINCFSKQIRKQKRS